MKLTSAPSRAVAGAGQRRQPLLVRCTATVEPQANPAPAPVPPAVSAPFARSSSPRSSSPRSSSPRRRDWRQAPRTELRPAGLAGAPNGDSNAAAGAAGAHGEQRRAQGARPAVRRPEVSFLDFDEKRIRTTAAAMYKRCHSQGQGMAVRALGRMGVAAAVDMILELKRLGSGAAPASSSGSSDSNGAAAAAGDASTSQRVLDVRFKLRSSDSIPGFAAFGPPLTFLTDSVPVEGGAQSSPAEGDVHATIRVSTTTEPGRLAGALKATLTDMPFNKTIRMEMVGPDTLLKGLSVLSQVTKDMGPVGGTVTLTPEAALVPLDNRTPAQPEGAAAPAAESPASSSSGSAEGAAEGGSESASTSGGMLRVVRMYLRKGAVVAREPGQAKVRQPGSAPAEQPVAQGRGGEEVTVPAAEWDALKGAVSTMMEQQKVLTTLLAQQSQQQQH